MIGGALFVLGSHVRHVAAGVRGVRVRTNPDQTYAIESAGVRWYPLCRQQRPRNDSNGLPWPLASTPAQNSRPVCSHCVREAARIARALL